MSIMLDAGSVRMS